MNESSKPAGTRVKPIYPFETVPAMGTTVEVAPGVLWMRMPLPFALAHINVWAIEDGPGWTIVDTGMRTPETSAAWSDLFNGPLQHRPVTRVFATHMHPDHVGMSGWITRKFACRLWMTRLEYLYCMAMGGDTGREAPADGISFYRRAGWNEQEIDTYRARFGHFGETIYSIPDSYRRIRDGERIMIGRHEWRVIVGNGHSPEHACLYCPELKVLISGDQVLPKISSNVSVHPVEPDAEPLSDWLTSLVKLEQSVPDDVLVLPAHNEPFRNLHARLTALSRGHERALDALRKTLAQPRRVIDVFGALFASKVHTPEKLSLATGESIAHLNYLVARGEAIAQADSSGVLWYRAA